MWTSVAPADFRSFTSFFDVVPRTIESSTRTTRLPPTTDRTGFSFTLTPKFADRLLRLDEGPADVVVPHEPHAVRDAALLGVAEGREDPRVGDGDDDVGRDGVLAGEAPPERAAGLRDRLVEDGRVGAREVDVLEDAEGRPPSHRERTTKRRRPRRG